MIHKAVKSTTWNPSFSSFQDCVIIPVTGQDIPADIMRLYPGVVGYGSLANKSVGSTTTLPSDHLSTGRFIMVQCGTKDITPTTFDKICLAVGNEISKLENTPMVTSTLLMLPDLKDTETKSRRIAYHLELQTFSFTLKTSKQPNDFADTITHLDGSSAGLSVGAIEAESVLITRTLGDLPGNICTPTYLANFATEMADQFPLMTTNVLDEAEMQELGMGALLSVSKGSAEPAKMIVMKYSNGTDGEAPYVFVGKGLTFDSGGVSLKPSANMQNMKYDMCGGASVFGLMHAIARLNLPVNVIGIVPSSENMPSSTANKPGDIVTSMSGLTIEVNNTDAEGRLILCDAITYAHTLCDPKVIVDIATLTGAVVAALGHHTIGLMSNSKSLTDDLLSAGETAMDKAWELPLGEEYQKQIDGTFGDISNTGTAGAGSITAGCFLSRFAEDVEWAHLDIAGVAWKKRATGRPVSLLLQYMMNKTETKK